MARTVRSITVHASAEEVWELVSDPHHLPRWWPHITRVEAVSAAGFTQVIPTKRGRPMRMDFLVTEEQAPGLRAWRQETVGTPFERIVSSWTTTVTLTPQPTGTVVTLEEVQVLRGLFRFGVPLQRRPARRRLDAALHGLAGLFADA